VSVALEFACWWSASVVVWLASLSAFSGHDLLVAVVCGLPSAAVALAARRAIGGAWRPSVAVVGWLLVLPWSLAVDTVRVLSLPWRPHARNTGGFGEVPLGPTGDTAEAAGRRAAASLLISSTPGGYVVAMDAERGTGLLHRLGPPSLLERRVVA
jgi:multisubunit Na+/H+ antiporter MnhE subunit